MACRNHKKTNPSCHDCAMAYEPTCDICRVEFPNSKPNVAVYDSPIRGAHGAWGYLCEGHKSHGLQLNKLK